MSKLEVIQIKYANAVLDAKNRKTNPTLGELVDEPVQEVKDLMLELVRGEYHYQDTVDELLAKIVQKVSEL